LTPATRAGADGGTMRRVFLLLLALLTGCASNVPVPSAQSSLLADAAFAPPSQPVSSAGLFTLSPAMRAYLNSPAFKERLHDKGVEAGLVKALYSQTDLQLEYDASRTRTAAETYAARSGNCLALVIMTAAFAKELGMTVRYQSVEVEQTWSRSGGLYVGSGHVNVVLGHRRQLFYDSSASQELVVDFLPPKEGERLRTRRLEEEDIVALYMNNRAVETLAEGHLDDAYWWARAAIADRLANAAPYNTLGVIYQRHGDLALAEQAYRAALAREPDNIAVMQNLVPVLAAMGRGAEAQALAQRVARLEPAPPFHYFNQGLLAMGRGDYGAARNLFAREVERAPYDDEFHFWLAQALLRLGDARQADRQLAMAVDTSIRPGDRQRYSSKLAHLRQLANAAQAR
jgi:Tfp pilus assembly protein PilF